VRARLAIGVGASLLVLGIAACSLVTDLGSLTSGDAAMDSPMMANDAAPDTTLPDAGSSDADAASTFSCSAIDAEFCDDFDKQPALLPWWQIVLKAPDASVALEQDASPSPPNALVARTDGPANGSQASAYVQHDINATIGHVRIDLDARVEAIGNLPIQSVGAVFRIDYASGPYAFQFSLALKNGSQAFASQAVTAPDAATTYAGTNFTMMLPTGSWMHVRAELDLPNRTYSVWFGPNLVGTGMLNMNVTPSSTLQGLRVGLHDSRYGVWQIRVDNVVLDWQ
jgi:hypothetical protein